jgi:hypothetical protein
VAGNLTIDAKAPVAGVLIAILFVAVILIFAVLKLGRTRPGFTVANALMVAFAIRLLAIVAINATGLGASLRGGDETTFLDYAQILAAQPIGHGYLPHGINGLQVITFAFQIKLGFINPSAIRVTQAGISLLAYAFMLAATYDLGGAKATRVAAWCLAFEPSSIFFNTEIHKEPLLELAAGLVAFGGVWIWKRLDIRGVLICSIGCLIGIETRGYAGWFLVGACVLMLIHASLRNIQRKGLAVAVLYAVLIAGALLTPTLLAATSGKNLKALQDSQTQNTTGADQGGTNGSNGSNLALESVDVSTRGAVITSLPKKISELLLQPYPWQLHDASQAFGAIGTLVAYLIMVLLIRFAWINRGSIFGRAGPLLYPMLFELVAYSVTVGNAGTGFRYRSHLVTLGICITCVLWASARKHREVDDDEPEKHDLQDSPLRSFQPINA